MRRILIAAACVLSCVGTLKLQAMRPFAWNDNQEVVRTLVAASHQGDQVVFAELAPKAFRHQKYGEPLSLPIEFYEGLKLKKMDGGEANGPVVATFYHDSVGDIKQRFIIRHGQVIRVDDLEEANG